MTRRYVIVGAGAVGGALGGALHVAGRDVCLVARGAHLDALRAHGLTWITPEGTRSLVIATEPSAAIARPDDVVIVATKSQDTAAAIAPIASRDTPIFCAQNGVANERIAHERSDRVYGVVVFAPLAHLAPGVVTLSAGPSYGGIDLGCDPRGDDALAHDVAADLQQAGFDARARPDIRRWKYGKLLTNLGNVLEALGGRDALRPEWLTPMLAEAEAVLAAARIDHASVADVHTRFAAVRETLPRPGGSTWQSLARGVPLETEWLNGEIVRLGAAHGVPTPIHAHFVALSKRAQRERWAPGTVPLADLAPPKA